MTIDELSRSYQRLQGTVQRLERAVKAFQRLHLKDVLNRYGWGRSTLYRKLSAGQIPRPVRLGGQPTWRLEDLERAELTGNLPPPISS